MFLVLGITVFQLVFYIYNNYLDVKSENDGVLGFVFKHSAGTHYVTSNNRTNSNLNNPINIIYQSINQSNNQSIKLYNRASIPAVVRIFVIKVLNQLCILSREKNLQKLAIKQGYKLTRIKPVFWLIRAGGKMRK